MTKNCFGDGMSNRVNFTLFLTTPALLSGTLRTYTRVSCDDNPVTLRCPPGTTIAVQRAQYENDDQQCSEDPAAPSPASAASAACKHGQCSGTHSPESNAVCAWPHALQVIDWKLFARLYFPSAAALALSLSLGVC